VTNFNFFVDKIRDIRLDIPSPCQDPSVPPLFTSIRSQFEPVTLPVLQDILCQIKPFGSSYDTLPLFFLNQFLIGPTVLKIMNSCLETAMVPDDMKFAIVHPLLKSL